MTALGERHRITLLCLRPEEDPSCDELVRDRCELVEEFELPGVGRTATAGWRRRGRLLWGLARRRPMWVTDTGVGAYARRLHELVREWKPDVVQAEYHVMAQYLRDLPHGPQRVLTEIEPGTSAAADAYRNARLILQPLLRTDAGAWGRFEREILGDTDAVVVYTERDRRELAALAPHAPLTRIPMGFGIPPGPLSACGLEPESFLFVGNFMHPPNVEAARRLVGEIAPRIVSRRPAARLYIVGGRAPGSLRRTAGAKNGRGTTREGDGGTGGGEGARCLRPRR